MLLSLLTRALQRLRSVLSGHAGLVGVLAIALAFRLVYLNWFHAFPPGDVFNFLGIARGLPHGEYSPVEKRLPFYPLLILLAQPVLDWEVAAVTIAVVASLASLVFLYAIGRTLGLSKTSLAVVLLVFQAQPQFLIASTRGYADTTFLALTLAALLGVLKTRTIRGAIISGVLFGAASLTRYEALAVSALLLPFWVLFPRRLPVPAHKPEWFVRQERERGDVPEAASRPTSVLARRRAERGERAAREPERTLRGRPEQPAQSCERLRLPRRLPLLALGVFLLTLLPYVFLSAANERPIFGGGYIEQAAAGDYGAANVREVMLNARGMWQRAGLLGLWTLLEDTVRDIRYDPFGTPRVLVAKLVEPTLVPTAAALLGIVTLVIRRKFWSVLMLGLAFLAITVPIAWWQPLRRFDVFLMPAVSLLSAAGLTGVQRVVERGTAERFGRLTRVGLGILLFLAVGGFWLPSLAEQTKNAQAKHNGRDYAFYQAIHAARSLPGAIVFDTGGRGITELYFRGRAVDLESLKPDDQTPRGVLAALRSRGATYAVVAAGQEGRFPFLSQPGVEVMQVFEWPTVNDGVSRAWIYQLADAAPPGG